MSTDNANSTTRPQAAACGSKQPPVQGKTYVLIAGEASGDLHAANLIAALRKCDPAGKFYAYGGDKMREAGAELLCNYRDIAYMGFVPVMLHFRVILRAMARCKRQISEISPDVVILVDYPGFNLSIAEYVKKHTRIPVFYYISPKIWAWRESRIKNIRRDVDEMFCILPFETDFYARHNYKVHYVGNPTVDEVDEFKRHRAATVAKPQQTEKTIALLAGSRKQEIKDNLRKMCIAAEPFTHKGYKIVVAAAPSLDTGEYARHIPGGMLADGIPRFPKAEVYVSETEYNGWTAMPEKQKLSAIGPLEAYGDRLHLFSEEDSLPCGVKQIPAYGHTPGHTVYQTGNLLIVGDIMHGATLQSAHPEICADFDMDKPAAIESRVKILDYARKNSLVMAGMHFPEPAFIFPSGETD